MSKMAWKPLVPWSMVLLRALLGPVILIAAARNWLSLWLGSIVIAALVLDIYDGILARHWDCDTSAVRLADSLADTIFYLGVLVALWIRAPWILRSNWQLLVALLLTEAARYTFDLCKFHKGASYHTYLAKTWGLVMALAVIGVFLFSDFHPLLWTTLIRASILIGILTNVEGFAISIILPRWQKDVKTFHRAWSLRKQMLATPP